MKFNYIKSIVPVAAVALSLGLTSCMSDLSRDPIDPTLNTTIDQQALFNKCYAGLIMEGNDGSSDFSIDDAGKSTLLRNLFNFNEIPTDEAICWWSDGGIVDVGQNQFSAGNATLKNLFYRLMSNITYCNHYLSPDVCGDSDDKTMTAEVRFLRAYYYYQMLDMFGNPPFITEISSEAAPQAYMCTLNEDGSVSVDKEANAGKTAAEKLALGQKFMYSWIESELLDCVNNMSDAKAKTSSTQEGYGRADKAAAWLLLSRLYLNHKSYLGTENTATYQKAADYAKMVYNGTGYGLFTGEATNGQYHYTAYDMLFMGDNGESGAACEAVLPLLQDGLKTQGWGGTVFFTAALWNAEMATAAGQDAGTTANNWSGMRVRKQLLQKFTDDPYSLEGKTAKEIREALAANANTKDDRAIFYGNGFSVDLGDNSDFHQGLASPKWNNNYSTGATPHDNYSNDIDYFLFRAAEAYLNFAEATMRANNGTCTGEAQSALDAVRKRAHAAVKGTYTLNDVLDERSREFYLEGLRRPDLIRYGQFGGSSATYTWDYKGGNPTGATFKSDFNVYPIPETEIQTNENLSQNPGY